MGGEYTIQGKNCGAPIADTVGFHPFGSRLAAPGLPKGWERIVFAMGREAPRPLPGHMVNRMFSSARSTLCASSYFSRVGATKLTVTDW